MSIQGKTIVGVDHYNAEEFDFWDNRDMVVLELDDGSKLFAMQDEEGNGPGVLIRRTHYGDEYVE